MVCDENTIKLHLGKKIKLKNYEFQKTYYGILQKYVKINSNNSDADIFIIHIESQSFMIDSKFDTIESMSCIDYLCYC